MSGPFTGLTDKQWEIIEQFLPRHEKRMGRPPPDMRKVINTILYVQITGCRWCDVPKGEQWAPRSTAHEWLGKLQDMGIWERVKNELLTLADRFGLIDWSKGAVDGSFSPW